jgi:hypothetical protein
MQKRHKVAFLKQNETILDLMIRKGIKHRRTSSGKYVVHCPLHEDVHPSAVYTPSEGWYCHRCEKRGITDNINLYTFLLGLDPAKKEDNAYAIKKYYEELREVKGMIGVNEDRDNRMGQSLSKLAGRFFGGAALVKDKTGTTKISPQRTVRSSSYIYKALQKEFKGLSREAREYLNTSRGLDDKTIDRFQIFEIDDHKKAKDFLFGKYLPEELRKAKLLEQDRDRFTLINYKIIIPITDGGEIVALKGRWFKDGNPNPPKALTRYRTIGHVSGTPFNMDVLKEISAKEKIYITEGEIDAITLSEMGKKAVALSSLNEQVIKLFKGLKVVIAPDYDKDGRGLEWAENLQELFMEYNQQEVDVIDKYPDGCKDINELYVKKLKRMRKAMI